MKLNGPDENIRVIKVTAHNTNLKVEDIFIYNDVDSFTSITGGYFTLSYATPFSNKDIWVCHKESFDYSQPISGMQRGNVPVRGNFFFTQLDDKGYSISLTQEQVDFIMRQWRTNHVKIPQYGIKCKVFKFN